MIINTSKFKEFLKKATINYCIDSIQLNLTKDKVKSKMITSASDAISILDVPNEILPEMRSTDTIVMNFSEPSTSIVPFLNLIDDNEESSLDMKDEKIVLVQGKQKSNIFFCAPQVVNTFEADEPRADINYFYEMNIDDDFMESFNKIKKIGSKFGKIYFGVSDNQLYIETSDKQNRFSNGLKIELSDVVHDDLSMCFDFKNMTNVISILDGVFTCKFAYVAEQELGMLFIGNEDGSEKYYLMSRRDN